MHKLLIHITILFALIVLLCVPSAYGEGTAPSVSATVTTPVPHSGDVVDLGLSVYWASKNVGAKDPTDAGTYFAWGEKTYLPPLSLISYTFYDVKGVKYTKYTVNDNDTILDFSDDAARHNWQGYWRTPTKEDLKSLLQCNRSSGNNGLTIQSKINSSVSILLAKSGYEGVGTKWWSTLQWYNTNHVMFWTSIVEYNGIVWDYGYCLDNTTITTEWRYHGLPIRPVIDKCNIKARVQGSNDLLDENFPKGTIITLSTDYPGSCYDVKWNDITNNYYYPLGYDSNEYKCYIDPTNQNKICLQIPVLNLQTTYDFVYTIKKFDIVVNVEGQGSVEKKKDGQIDNSTKYDCGTPITLTAAPDACYTFNHWEKNGKKIDGGATLSVTVLENATYKAVFKERDPIDIAVTTDDSSLGTVNIVKP